MLGAQESVYASMPAGGRSTPPLPGPSPRGDRRAAGGLHAAQATLHRATRCG